MLDRIVLVGAGYTADSLVPRLTALAPLTVIDKSEKALISLQPAADADPTRVALRVADGTSRLVLEDVRATGDVGLVVATGNDRQNLEACRIGLELGYRPVVGIVIDAASEHAYEKLGVRSVVRATLLGQVVERALRYDGLSVATSIGQGDGSIVEFAVLPGSPAIGLSLSELHAEGWRIAAIYRGGRLVIPTGATTIEPEDRIVLVGAPDLVPIVAEQLRVGRPMFPLPHGRNVVAYMPNGRDEAVENEARALARGTRADGLIRAWPGAAEQSGPLDPNTGSVDARAKKLIDLPLTGTILPSHLAGLRNSQPGVIVTRIPKRTFWQAVLGRGGAAAELCNRSPAPVLFVQGRTTYARVVHPVLDDVADERIAYEAIDLARMLGLRVAIVRVSLPAYIASSTEAVGRIVASLERRMRSHEVPFETVALTGNPVRSIVGFAKPDDLLVMGRYVSTQDSFTAPDVALLVARRAAASALVRTLPAT